MDENPRGGGMKPAPFRYLAPRDESGLLSALGEHGGDARLLAGGQSLVPMMNFRVVTPTVLIDINGLSGLSFIASEADTIVVGALTRHAMLEDSDDLRERLPFIAEAMEHLAHRAVRNRGTMGGSLALAYPNAELPLLFVTLGAELRLRSARGERQLGITEFITGPLDTALADDEFIHSARIAVPPRSVGTAFVEVAQRHGDFALAAAAAVIDVDEAGRARMVQAGLSGGQGIPIRVPIIELALNGERPTASLIDEASRAAVDTLDVDDDRQVPAGYRRLLLTTVLQRAVHTAAERAERTHVH
jgi:CO/xanthine dehydrogenase FAD-binding subunit